MVTLPVGEPDEVAEAARARVAEGFGALKLKVGTDPDARPGPGPRRARGARPTRRCGSTPTRAGTAKTPSASSAALEDAGLGVELVEQPVPAHDLLGLAHVRRHVETPVMADESVFDLDDLVEVVRHRLRVASERSNAAADASAIARRLAAILGL